MTTAEKVLKNLTPSMANLIRKMGAACGDWFSAADINPSDAATVGALLTNLLNRGLLERRSDPNVRGRSQYRARPILWEVRKALVGEGLKADDQAAPTPLDDLASIADEIFNAWDRDQRPGKLLSALSGRLTNYDPRVTRIREVLAASASAAPQEPHPLDAVSKAIHAAANPGSDLTTLSNSQSNALMVALTMTMVQADFGPAFAIIGEESTGKSTLLAAAIDRWIAITTDPDSALIITDTSLPLDQMGAQTACRATTAAAVIQGQTDKLDTVKFAVIDETTTLSRADLDLVIRQLPNARILISADRPGLVRHLPSITLTQKLRHQP